MDESPLKKKIRRKIRSTLDFNQLDRKSIAEVPSKGYQSEKKVSKKKNHLIYLPKIDLDFGNNENSSPNFPEKKRTKSKLKQKKIDTEQNVETGKSSETKTRKSLKHSSDGEKRESAEIQFIKKRKKKRKQQMFDEQIVSYDTREVFDFRNEETNVSYIQDKSSKTPKTPNAKLKSATKTPNKEKNQFRSFSLEDLAPTPIEDEQLSDNVFVDDFKLSETLECNNNTSDKRNTFELKNSTFDVSQLPVATSELNDLEPKRKSVRFTRSVTKRKSNSFSTNEKYVSLLSNSTRKSVRFSKQDVTEKRSSIYQSNHSKSYPKSPHSKKVLIPSPNESFSPEIEPSPSPHSKKLIIPSPNESFSPEIEPSPSPHSKKLIIPSPNESFSPEIEPSPLNSYQENNFDDLNIKPNNLFEVPSTSKNTTLYTSFEVTSPTGSGSKVTKRKTWNKSLGVAFLDSSGLLHNIPAPWYGDSFNFNIDQSSNSLSLSKESNSSDESISPIKKTSVKKISDGNSKTEENPVGRKKSLLRTSNLMHNSPKATYSGINSYIDSTSSPVTNSKAKKTVQINTSKNEIKSTAKKTKMPNFALIHQRANDKLENLIELKERKYIRAQILLSGKKPGVETSSKMSDKNLKVKPATLKIKSPKSRKLLRYAPATVTNIHGKVAPSTSNPKVTNNKPILKKKTTSNIPKLVINPKEPQKETKLVIKPTEPKKGITKLGFKSGTGRGELSKQEQIKAVANKTKVQRNSLEAKRNAVQNVRSNRRFELLMKMRKGKK